MPKAEPTIQIIPVGWDELHKVFSGSREYVLGTLNRALRRMGKTLVPAVKNETPQGATHRLRNTTVAQVTGTAEDMQLEIRQSAFSPKGFPYGAAVRMGTRPHFPPPAALVPWVERKLGLEGAEAQRVARAIAFKISRVGTQPNSYHTRAFESSVGELRSIMNEEVLAMLDRIEKQAK